MAEQFLGEAIESSLKIGYIEPLCQLIKVMSDEEYTKSPHLKFLAEEIVKELNKQSLG